MNHEVRNKMRKRHQAFKKWKRQPTDHNFQCYTESREAEENAKLNAKDGYYNRLSNQLTNPATSAKHFWKLTKELYGSKVRSGIPPLIKDDVVHSTASAKCKLLNEHFAKKAQFPDIPPDLRNFP